MVIPNIYREKLSEGEIDQLRDKSIDELRNLRNEDTELFMKAVKAYKEFLSILPEGRRLLNEGKSDDKGITIILNQADSNEKTTVDVTPSKKEEEKE